MCVGGGGGGEFLKINSRFCSKFLLVSGRHVGALPNGHQHGVSIQISIKLS